jgi:hypothetical protein
MCYAGRLEACLRILGIVTAALFSSSAWAADCATPYTIDAFLEDLTAVEVALREGDDTGLTSSSTRLGDGLACLDEIMPALLSARAYRAVGAGLLASGDEAAADRWLLTSLEVEPTWDYGTEDIPAGHPLRDHFDALKLRPAVDPVAVEGKAFGEGEFYLNGRKITKPRARPERNHVFQAQTATLSTDVIVGNAFPDTVLVATAGPVADSGGKEKKPDKVKREKPPKGEKPPKPPKTKKAARTKTKIITLPNGETTEIIVPETPKEKIPLIIGGSAILAGSGVLYYLASRTASEAKGITSVTSPGHMATLNGTTPPEGSFRFCSAGETPGSGCYANPNDEADTLRRRTNNYVLASLSLFAVGAGVTTWGIIVDGGRPMPTVNVRF